MSDTNSAQTMSADTQEASGHGKHRGPVSVQESESAAHGRHRKPSEQAEQSRYAAV
ncbi:MULTISPECIES: hypothetical protein [unclassified Streptomyces]|uniref:Uncharacterized protein n=1 Tax=Streptomyces sp. R08 TaxID=3238624 RepID=A0AB39M500_9ACTN|nr:MULTISPECIES: hypothetical protein [unclassified Streptomyces]MCX4810692.1 hypothetical protein [Streptomyces sp. NBC_01239]UXX93165.1 hypothetical protein N7U49_14850 [Streptomyces sp. AD2-2]